MKTITVLAVVVAILVIIYMKNSKINSHSKGPKSGNISDIIEWAKIEAPKDAKENYGIELNYTDESVVKVEEILGKMYKPGLDPKKLPTGVRGMAILYGVYIGECIIRNHGGIRWELDHAVGGKGSMPVIMANGASFPVGWCLKRLVNGEEDNVWNKYQISIINRKQ